MSGGSAGDSWISVSGASPPHARPWTRLWGILQARRILRRKTLRFWIRQTSAPREGALRSPRIRISLATIITDYTAWMTYQAAYDRHYILQCVKKIWLQIFICCCVLYWLIRQHKHGHAPKKIMRKLNIFVKIGELFWLDTHTAFIGGIIPGARLSVRTVYYWPTWWIDALIDSIKSSIVGFFPKNPFPNYIKIVYDLYWFSFHPAPHIGYFCNFYHYTPYWYSHVWGSFGPGNRKPRNNKTKKTQKRKKRKIKGIFKTENRQITTHPPPEVETRKLKHRWNRKPRKPQSTLMYLFP